MNKLIGGGTKTLLFSGLLLATFACSDDLEEAKLDETQTVSKTEVKTILQTNEFSSAADGVITDIFQQGTSAKSANDDCYITDFSDTGFTVSFDNCSVEDSDETLNGTVTVTYEEGAEATSFSATYSNLSVDGIIINGSRNFTFNTDADNESVSFTIVSDITIELADGDVIEESGTQTVDYIFDFENLENSGLSIAGNWIVKAEGNTYTVNIPSGLVANFTCDYFGKGIMQIGKNGLEVVIDFGDGTCDDVATMTYPDGTVEELSLKD